MILNTLKKDSLSARKNKETIKANLLITLISEITMKAKNDGDRKVTDEDAIAALKKFEKSGKEAMAALKKDNRDISQAEEELTILASYLPKQLNEAELKNIITAIVSALPEKSPKMMGGVMAEMSQKYRGQYDGKLVSTLVKDALSS